MRLLRYHVNTRFVLGRLALRSQTTLPNGCSRTGTSYHSKYRAMPLNQPAFGSTYCMFSALGWWASLLSDWAIWRLYDVTNPRVSSQPCISLSICLLYAPRYLRIPLRPSETVTSRWTLSSTLQKLPYQYLSFPCLCLSLLILLSASPSLAPYLIILLFLFPLLLVRFHPFVLVTFNSLAVSLILPACLRTRDLRYPWLPRRKDLATYFPFFFSLLGLAC